MESKRNELKLISSSLTKDGSLDAKLSYNGEHLA